ncbi:MAG TPA: hypothetical protein VJA21_01695, partial [Verrucomicrobiae bacterium]
MKPYFSWCSTPTYLASLIALALLCSSAARAQAATVFTNDTLIGVLDTNYDGAELVVSNCTLMVDGVHSFASIRLLSGGMLTHSFSSNGWLTVDGGSNVPSGLDLTVSNDFLVESGSVINANGRGFGAGSGPGFGKSSGWPASGSGGGHGGFGGASGTNSGITLAGGVYDLIATPSEKGSGGGRGYQGEDFGGNGGGSIRI